MKPIHFTKREKIVSVIGIVALILVFIIPLKDEYEYLWLFFVVLPIGILLATDPARKK